MDLQEIHKIYNGFEVKDMPRHEFIKKMRGLTSTANIQRDLGRIMAQKQTATIRAAREKQKISRAIKENG